MGVLWLLGLTLFLPFVLFLAYLAVSSCLGDNFRPRISGVTINPRHALFDRNYLRSFSTGGQGSREQLEMDEMMDHTTMLEDDEP